MPYRIVICVDVDANTLLQAYGKLYMAMGSITGPKTGLDWESSDEAYGQDGEQIDEDTLQKARTTYFEKRNAKESD